MEQSGSQIGVGDIVMWVSQGRGVSKRKAGEVIAVIEPGSSPNHRQFRSVLKGGLPNRKRKVVSYIVKGYRRLYWPRTQHLQCVQKAMQFAA